MPSFFSGQFHFQKTPRPSGVRTAGGVHRLSVRVAGLLQPPVPRPSWLSGNRPGLWDAMPPVPRLVCAGLASGAGFRAPSDFHGLLRHALSPARAPVRCHRGLWLACVGVFCRKRSSSTLRQPGRVRSRRASCAGFAAWPYRAAPGSAGERCTQGAGLAAAVMSGRVALACCSGAAAVSVLAGWRRSIRHGTRQNARRPYRVVRPGVSEKPAGVARNAGRMVCSATCFKRNRLRAHGAAVRRAVFAASGRCYPAGRPAALVWFGKGPYSGALLVPCGRQPSWYPTGVHHVLSHPRQGILYRAGNAGNPGSSPESGGVCRQLH